MCVNYTLLKNELKITYLANYLIKCYIVNVLFLFNQLQEVVNLKHTDYKTFKKVHVAAL